MSREELWKVFTDRNPALLGDGAEPVTLRRRGIKKLFDAAYDAGLKAQFGGVKEPDNFPDIFRDMFGGKN
jgi:hypothetical protein